MNYKVVVIGAGPGGVVLARELAKRGVSVDIYEKGLYEDLGHDWSDAMELIALSAAGFEMPVLDGLEWKGALVKEHQNADGIFEKHAVPRLKICSPGLTNCKEVDFLMITTDRLRLGRLLVDQAVAAGAQIFYRHQGLELSYTVNGRRGPDGVEVNGVVVRNLESGIDSTVQADLVVESSGFQSVLRKSLPAFTGLADSFQDNDFALVHREVRGYNQPAQGQEAAGIPDHYRYGFHTGYQWTHIHNSESIDVGAGVKNDPANPDPRDLIEEFISRHPAITDLRIRGGRSLCIVGIPLLNFVSNGFIVIGDAASTSVPTTGCGAGSAMLIGLWAADVVTEAAREERNDIGKLWEINTKFYCDSERGKSFAALAALRVMLQQLSHQELDFLFSKDLMDADTLQNAVNGIFKPPTMKKMLQSVCGGISNPLILLKLNKAISGAVRIYKHYQKYPRTWNADTYEPWEKKTNELMNSLSSPV